MTSLAEKEAAPELDVAVGVSVHCSSRRGRSKPADRMGSDAIPNVAVIGLRTVIKY